MKTNPNDIQLATLDIEGCLTQGKGKAILLKSLIALHEAEKQVPIVLCTGRPQPYAEAILQMLGLQGLDIGSIVENGCYLYYPNSDILVPHPDLNRDALSKVKEAVSGSLPKGTRFEPGKETCISLNPPAGFPITALYEFVKELLFNFNDYGGSVTVAHSNSAVDITPVGIDKGAGLKFLCHRMGISIDNVLSVGDSNNDFAVLEIAGHIACPANATEAVKNLVGMRNGYVATANDAAGVIEILRHYGIIKE